MRKHRVLRLPRLATVCFAIGVSACGDDGGSKHGFMTTTTGMTDAGTVATAADTVAASTVATGTMSSTVGAGGTTGTLTSTTGEMGDTCVIASLGLFSRSDTDAAWDDNDFSEVALESGCPTLVNVTWPHEEDWGDADPSEANSEETHFTLDSYAFGGDLTGKQLNLTIELTDDVRGPSANAGSYLVSLVSVSTYQYEPEDTDTGTGGTCSGGTAGAGGTGGVGGTATTSAGGTATTSAGGTTTAASTTTATTTTDTGGAGGAGGTTAAGVGGTCPDDGGMAGLAGAGGAPILATGYSEAETPRDARLVLRYVGDRATLVFPLPDKTDEIDSYDPSTAIKINVRIYNQSYGVEMPDDGMGGAGGLGGMGGAGGLGGTIGATSTDTTATGTGTTATSTTGTATTGTATTTSTDTTSTTTAGVAGVGGVGGVGGIGGVVGTDGTDGNMSTGGSGPVAIFDYVTTEFAITHLSVTERGQRP